MSRKDRHVSVDLMPEQKAQLRELAEGSGMSVSDYMRAVVVNAIKRKAQFTIEFTELQGSNSQLNRDSESSVPTLS